MTARAAPPPRHTPIRFPGQPTSVQTVWTYSQNGERDMILGIIGAIISAAFIALSRYCARRARQAR